jgi:hypothetical protein
MQGLATFFVRYNEWRQHQALGYQTPAAVFFGSYLEQAILILTLFCLDDGVRFIPLQQKNRAGDTAFAGPRSPAPLARGGLRSRMHAVLQCASWHIVQQHHGRLRLCLCQANIVTLSHALRMETAQKSSPTLSASLPQGCCRFPCKSATSAYSHPLETPTTTYLCITRMTSSFVIDALWALAT